MALPAFFDQRADALSCVGRQGFKIGEDFSFGDYQVLNVKRGWTRRIRWDVAFADGSAAHQEFEYQVRAPDGTLWQGNAVTGVRREDVTGRIGGGTWSWDLSSDVHYLVRLADEAQEHFWTLAMRERLGDTVMNGELSDGTTVYRVEGTYRLAGTPMPLSTPAGFIVYQQHRPVAAVEVINQGMVYLARDVEPTQRHVLAGAATALLLYKDIGGR